MKRYYPLYILLLALLSSCATLSTVSLDQLYPAAVNFPHEVNNVAVVNNMLQTRRYRSDELNKGTFAGDGNKLSGYFASALADNAYFNQVVICDSALRNVDDEVFEREIPQREVKNLVYSLASDILLSTDVMTVSITRDKFQYPGMPDPFPIIRVDAKAKVSSYMGNRSKPLFSVAVHDSLFWDLGAGVSDSIVMDEACHKVATSLVAKVVPQWKNIDRAYFDGACAELRDGAVCLRENDLAGAADAWTALYEKSKKGGLKVKAAFNMALVSELKGDVASALVWLEKADTYAKDGSEEKYLIITYSDVLKLRKNDLSILHLQMKRFEK